MGSARLKAFSDFYSLRQAAEILAVSIDTLIEWNDNNILKPTITQDGLVGYKEEQIEKFLEIRKLIQNPSPVDEQLTNPFAQSVSELQKISLTNNNPNQKRADKIPSKTETAKLHYSTKDKSRPIILLSIFSVIAILLLAGISFQQDNKSLLPYNDNSVLQNKPVNLENISTQQISQVGLQESTKADTHKPIEYVNISNNLNNINTSNENLSALHSIIKKEATTTVASDSQMLIVPQSDTTIGIEYSLLNPVTYGTNYNSAANRASRPNLNNIGTQTPSDFLALDLSLGEVFQNNESTNQKSPSTFVIGLYILSIISLLFISNKSPAFLALKTNTNGAVPSAHINNAHNQKILEINQKTDGTVVIFFQSNEYKISKPELNSESDQFIERLLDFAPGNVKEVNYDITEDEKIKLNAPLSKLVTRLGFVGLKRELFFPRTSKNVVLFRKYLTEDDLASMSLTRDKILNELSN